MLETDRLAALRDMYRSSSMLTLKRQVKIVQLGKTLNLLLNLIGVVFAKNLYINSFNPKSYERNMWDRVAKRRYPGILDTGHFLKKIRTFFKYLPKTYHIIHKYATIQLI